MGAKPPVMKEMAGTRPLMIGVANGVVIVRTVENDRKLAKGDALGLLGISMSFFNFTN